MENMKAAVVTLGCKVNQFESSALMDALRREGYDVLQKAVGADLVILNTCTVTHKADQEALSLLRRLRRQNPAAKVLATGCLAQSNPKLLVESGLVDLILGQDEKADLARHLAPEKILSAAGVQVGELRGPARDFGAPAPERTRAFYKIQDGCSAHCAYCAVPLSRGPSRSLELETVLAGLRAYMERGVAEVALCGIHLGHWGADLSPRLSLAELLHAVAGELAPDAGEFRLRLSSIEPLEIDDGLIMAYELYPWLARHLHLPLQSGSDRVLEMMGRPYRAADFKNLVERLKAAWPEMALGLDVMVGFPGETEKMFLETRNFLEELPVSYAHIFPYSPRPGTRAAASPDQLPEPEKKRRASALKAVDLEKRRLFAQANLGHEELALVENTPHAKSGRLKILTGNYLYALLPKGVKPALGTLIPVTLSPSDDPSGLLSAVL